MGHYDLCFVVFVPEGLKELQNLPPCLGIKLASGFVCQDDLWVVCQCGGQGYSLLLAAGKLIGSVYGAILHVHKIKELFNPGLSERGGLGCKPHGKFDVLIGREGGNQVEELEYETYLLPSEPDKFGIGKVGNVLSTHGDGTCGRSVKSSDEIKQSGFSTARWTHYGDYLTLSNIQVHTPKCNYLGLAGLVDPHEVFNLYFIHTIHLLFLEQNEA